MCCYVGFERIASKKIKSNAFEAKQWRIKRFKKKRRKKNQRNKIKIGQNYLGNLRSMHSNQISALLPFLAKTPLAIVCLWIHKTVGKLSSKSSYKSISSSLHKDTHRETVSEKNQEHSLAWYISIFLKGFSFCAETWFVQGNFLYKISHIDGFFGKLCLQSRQNQTNHERQINENEFGEDLYLLLWIKFQDILSSNITIWKSWHI